MQEADLPLTYLLALEERHWQHHQRISTSRSISITISELSNLQEADG